MIELVNDTFSIAYYINVVIYLIEIG